MARVVPMLRGAQVIRVWAGFEGYLPDMLPVMGWSRTTKSLLHGFRFCGHGFQLSPGVGYTLAEMIDEGAGQHSNQRVRDRPLRQIPARPGTPYRRVRRRARVGCARLPRGRAWRPHDPVRE